MTESPVNGRLRIRAASRGGRTVLTDVYRTAPFHPGPLHYRDGLAELLLQEVSSGIFPEDRLDIEVEIGEGAFLAVSSQGATKIYSSPTGNLAEMRTTLRIAHGGALWWLPGPLIPFRDARYCSQTTVRLSEGSRFALIEIITPGRLAMGERDLYSELDLRLCIELDGKPILVERALLEPKMRPLSMVGRRGRFACFGSLTMIGYPPPTTDNYVGNDVWLGADGGDELAVVRGLAQAATPLHSALRSLLQQADYQRNRASLERDVDGVMLSKPNHLG